MTSNLYLFEATHAEGAGTEKSLTRIIHEAETARSAEGARLIRKLGDGIADYFRRATTSADVVPDGNAARQQDTTDAAARAYV
jgi:hypothetical protein